MLPLSNQPSEIIVTVSNLDSLFPISHHNDSLFSWYLWIIEQSVNNSINYLPCPIPITPYLSFPYHCHFKGIGCSHNGNMISIHYSESMIISWQVYDCVGWHHRIQTLGTHNSCWTIHSTPFGSILFICSLSVIPITHKSSTHPYPHPNHPNNSLLLPSPRIQYTWDRFTRLQCW